MRKIIVICHNYEPAHTPRQPDPEDRFYTYGFGGNMAKNVKVYLPEYEVECWRLDGYTDNYHEKVHRLVKYRVFPSLHSANLFDFSLKFLRELKKELKRSNPILILTHTHYWLAYQVAILFGKSKLIATHHGEWSPFYRIKNTTGLRKIKAFIDMQAEKIAFRNIDYIFTCERKQIPLFKKAAPHIKCVLWSSGVNIENMAPIPKADARRMLGWDHDKKYILYVGKLYKFKQAGELIKTWQEIKRERPEVELVVVGSNSTDKWEEYHDAAVKAGAKLTGRILNTELYKYYSAADVYVMFAARDDFYGGTGIAPLESLACNTPVVSTALRNYIGGKVGDVGEMPLTTEEYKNAILNVLDNPGKYKNMREGILSHYTFEAVYKKAGKVFDEMYSSN